MGSPLLLPLIAAQGLWVRRRVEVLPEASGPTTGTTNGPAGEPVRLVVAGESTAAGCGAPTHDAAFTGAFARAIAERRGRPVRWSVYGRHGATIRRVRHRVLPDIDTDAEMAVLLIGVNDVLNRTPAPRWEEDVAAVVAALSRRAETVVVAGIPPFEAFPSLPRALGRYLAGRGRALDEITRALCATSPATIWVPSTELVPAGPEFFARDGFHPSVAGYARWAKALADQITHRGQGGRL